MLVPSISRIPWERCPTSFTNNFIHYGLSGPLIICLYYWGFTVSGNITALIWPGCIFTSPVVLLVCAQTYPVFGTEYIGTAILGGLIGWTIDMWLDIRLRPCILLALVLYMCTSGMLHEFPLYGCVSGKRDSVSYGMTWGFF